MLWNHFFGYKLFKLALVESEFDDVVALQLYVDGKFLEEHRMTEHYEP